MTDKGKFYADRPDKDAIPERVFNFCSNGMIHFYDGKKYINRKLNIEYIPRPWWKLWMPKYVVEFIGDQDV